MRYLNELMTNEQIAYCKVVIKASSPFRVQLRELHVYLDHFYTMVTASIVLFGQSWISCYCSYEFLNWTLSFFFINVLWHGILAACVIFPKRMTYLITQLMFCILFRSYHKISNIILCQNTHRWWKPINNNLRQHLPNITMLLGPFWVQWPKYYKWMYKWVGRKVE